MQKKREDILFGFFCLVLATSLGLNVLQFRWLQGARVVDRNSAPAGFPEGLTLPKLPFETPEGQPGVLSFATDTLVYVFAPGCDWCRQDYPNIKAIQQATSKKFPFMAVTRYGDNPPPGYTKKLRDYLDTHTYPQVALVKAQPLGPDIVRGFGLTPQLLLVRAGGKIEKVWHGALMGSRRAEAQEYLQSTSSRLSGTRP